MSSDPGVSDAPWVLIQGYRSRGADPEVSDDPGVSDDTGVLGDPGVSGDSGVSGDPGVSINPGVQRSPGMTGDPVMTGDPGMSGDPGVSGDLGWSRAVRTSVIQRVSEGWASPRRRIGNELLQRIQNPGAVVEASSFSLLPSYRDAVDAARGAK